MRILHRYAALADPRPKGRREPDLPELIAGVAIFLLLAAACLYAVARLGA